MNLQQSLVIKSRSDESNQLFDKIRKSKNTSFFYMSEVLKYVQLGAVTCINIVGNKYRIKSNVSEEEVELILK